MSVAGLEWLGARAYDSGVRSFLGVDPLEQVAGSATMGNPYAYAGNNPVNLYDPTGLKPVSEADLKAYNNAHQSVLVKAAGAVGDAWNHAMKAADDFFHNPVVAGIIGGAAIIAGGALMFTGVGGPAGMMLISGGISTVSQVAFNPDHKVDWKTVAVDTAMGALGGPIGKVASLGAKAVAQVGEHVGEKVATRLGTEAAQGMLTKGLSSAASSDVSYMGNQLVHGEKIDAGQLGVNTVTGLGFSSGASAASMTVTPKLTALAAKAPLPTTASNVVQNLTYQIADRGINGAGAVGTAASQHIDKAGRFSAGITGLLEHAAS